VEVAIINAIDVVEAGIIQVIVMQAPMLKDMRLIQINL